MKRLSLFISLLWVTISLALACTDGVSDMMKAKMAENGVAVTGTMQTLFGEGSVGGQGTIIKDSADGAIVLTAGHVAADASNAIVGTRDGKLHDAKVHWISKKSDIAELVIPGYHSKTHATIAALKAGEELHTFGYVDYTPYYMDGQIINFVFTFSDEFYSGHAVAKIDPAALVGYGPGRENLWLARIFADHGSSGEGVYNKDGNLVGVISGGNGMKKNVTYIVAAKEALKDKEDGKDIFEKEPDLKDLIKAVKEIKENQKKK